MSTEMQLASIFPQDIVAEHTATMQELITPGFVEYPTIGILYATSEALKNDPSLSVHLNKIVVHMTNGSTVPIGNTARVALIAVTALAMDRRGPKTIVVTSSKDPRYAEFKELMKAGVKKVSAGPKFLFWCADVNSFVVFWAGNRSNSIAAQKIYKCKPGDVIDLSVMSRESQNGETYVYMQMTPVNAVVQMPAPEILRDAYNAFTQKAGPPNVERPESDER
jgi:hypothetical protein